MTATDDRDDAVAILNWEGTNEIKSANDYNRSLLFAVLDALDGNKTIVWDRDRTVMHRVNLFAGASVLAAHGVVANHIIDRIQRAATPHVVFFLAPTMASLDLLCDYIDNVHNDPLQKILYQVCFIPEAWYVVRESLKLRAGGKYWERLESVREIPLCWLPRDGECLSLSSPQIASRLLINGDWTHLHKCAVALNQLVDMCRGRSSSSQHRPISIHAKGKWATDVARMIQKVRSTTEQGMKPVDPVEGLVKINRIVLIDRWLDPLTPMLSQLTYFGLLDELYNVGMVNSIKVPEAEFEEAKDGDPFKEKEIYLIDEVYHRLKHSHINAFSVEASKILGELRDDEQFDRENMSVAEYSVLVKKMPKIINRKKMIAMHMRLAEMLTSHLYCKLSDSVKVEKELLDYADSDKPIPVIEDQVFDAAPLNSVLRLISVHSLTSGGLKPSVLQHYRRIVNQSYGSSALNKVLKMQKMGLIREKGGGGKMLCEYSPMMFQQMKKNYQLLPESEYAVEQKLSDMAYAYSGFAPLLCKILEEGDKVKWAGWPRTVLGDERDPIAEKDGRGTCIFVIGGLTRSELAVIRENLPNVALITTSALITGDKLLENITNI